MSRIYLPNYCEICAYANWNKVYPFISSDWNTLERRVKPSVGGGVETQVFLCAAVRSIDWYSQPGREYSCPKRKRCKPRPCTICLWKCHLQCQKMEAIFVSVWEEVKCHDYTLLIKAVKTILQWREILKYIWCCTKVSNRMSYSMKPGRQIKNICKENNRKSFFSI